MLKPVLVLKEMSVKTHLVLVQRSRKQGVTDFTRRCGCMWSLLLRAEAQICVPVDLHLDPFLSVVGSTEISLPLNSRRVFCARPKWT